MIQLNKAQAAKALRISMRTLATRMKEGKIPYTKIEGAGVGEQSVFFSYEQLGIPEPSVEPAPVHDVQIAPQYNDPAPAPAFVPRQPTRDEQDAAFAEAYLSGEVTDSCGNTIQGNDRFPTKGKVGLLGPVEPQYNPQPDTTAHMTPGTVGGTPMIGTDGETITHAGSDNHPLNSEAFYEAWRRPGGPSFAEVRNVRAKLPHPNANRNDYLKNIFRDIRLGWSR